jgi:hypothetical protein
MTDAESPLCLCRDCSHYWTLGELEELGDDPQSSRCRAASISTGKAARMARVFGSAPDPAFDIGRKYNLETPEPEEK